MTTLSSFKFDQSGAAAGVWDRSRRDLALAGGTITCEAYEKSETTYLWEVVSAPLGSTPVLSGATTHTASLDLDMTGTFLVRLTVNGGLPDEHISTWLISIPLDGSGLYISGLSETNQDNSQSPYDGARGYEDKQNTFLRAVDQTLWRPVKTVTTSTLLEVDSGKTLRVTASGQTLTLPAVKKGLTYFFYCMQDVTILRGGTDSFLGPWGPPWTGVILKAYSSLRIQAMSDGAGNYSWYAVEGTGRVISVDSADYNWDWGFNKIETLLTNGAAGTVPVSDGAGAVSMQPVLWEDLGPPGIAPVGNAPLYLESLDDDSYMIDMQSAGDSDEATAAVGMNLGFANLAGAVRVAAKGHAVKNAYLEIAAGPSKWNKFRAYSNAAGIDNEDSTTAFDLGDGGFLGSEYRFVAEVGDATSKARLGYALPTDRVYLENDEGEIRTRVLDHDILFNARSMASDLSINDPSNINLSGSFTYDSIIGNFNQLMAAVQALTSSYNRRKAVIDYVDCTAAPPTEVSGDRYILDFTVGTVHADWDGAAKGDIVEFDGADWIATSPDEGWIAYVDDQDKDILYVDDGTPEWQYRLVYTQNHGDLNGVTSDQHHAKNHAATHVNGTDDIQLATDLQKGLMSSSYAGKLDGIEALADVTDAANVDSAGAVMEADFNANTILAADSDDTPTVRTIAEQQVVGRLTSGNIKGLSQSELKALVGLVPVSGTFGASPVELDSFPVGADGGVTWEYFIQYGENMRKGFIQAVWNDSASSISSGGDTATSDIGDTSDITFTIAHDGSNVEILSNNAGSNTWNYRIIRREI